jgi:DNA N-6-adenine-methyltransferase (Dam)
MTLGSHQRCVGQSQVHITPLWILERLGPFNLDPAAADPRPWDCARRNYTEVDDGLSRPWRGRVWLNPPFDRFQVALWIRRLAEHGHGTALLHARTEAGWFEPIWRSASGILFMGDRIHFHKPDGTRQPANSGAPAVLVSFGLKDLARLRTCGIGGVLVTKWENLAAPTSSTRMPITQGTACGSNTRGGR